MKQGASLVGALVLGVAGGWVGGRLAVDTSSPEPAPDSRDEHIATQAAELARLKTRVDALTAMTRAPRTEPRVVAPDDAAAASPAAAFGAEVTGGLVSSHASGVPADSDALRKLEQRVANLEKNGRGGTVVPEDLSKLSIPELDALVRNLQAEKRPAEALRVADDLSHRGELTADQRADADLNVGYSLRGLGRHAEAEARFRETLGRVGENSEKGAWVGFQLAWERYYQKDVTGAATEMEKTANNPAVSAIVRVHGLYNGGRFAKEAGDPARAHALLERLVRDHATDIPVSQAFMRAEAEKMLKEIDGR